MSIAALTTSAEGEIMVLTDVAPTGGRRLWSVDVALRTAAELGTFERFLGGAWYVCELQKLLQHWDNHCGRYRRDGRAFVVDGLILEDGKPVAMLEAPPPLMVPRRTNSVWWDPTGNLVARIQYDRRDIEYEDLRAPVATLDLWSGTTGRLLHTLRWRLPNDELNYQERTWHLGLLEGTLVETGIWGAHVLRYEERTLASNICTDEQRPGLLSTGIATQPGTPWLVQHAHTTWVTANLATQRCAARDEMARIWAVALAPNGQLVAKLDDKMRFITVASSSDLTRRVGLALPRDPSSEKVNGSPDPTVLFTADSRFVVVPHWRRLLAIDVEDGSALSIELRADGSAHFAPMTLTRDERPQGPLTHPPFGTFEPIQAP